MNMEQESFIKLLREIAMNEPKRHVKEILKTYANNLDHITKAFALVPNVDNLRDLNGIWARATKALDMVTPIVPYDDGIGGKLHAPKEKKAA